MFYNSDEIKKHFGVELIASNEMDANIRNWDSIFCGKAPWINSKDDIETVNMAEVITNYRAKLTTLDIGVKVDGSARAEEIQKITNKLLDKLTEKVAVADSVGGILIRYNGKSWDFLSPGEFGITEKDSDGNITGAIFPESFSNGNNHYTRLEYHRFVEENGTRLYKVTNKAFKNVYTGGNQYALGQQIALNSVEAWKDLAEEVTMSDIEYPLFAYYRVPGANNIDRKSPLGLSIFASALHELKAIDIAISRKDAEVQDSKHVTFVGQTVIQNAENQGIELPRFVKALGIGISDLERSSVHEHTATLLTEQRIKDINFNLSMAGIKCGFSEGAFVFDDKTGMVTATQVEADDRDTIQTIKADRDALKSALEKAIYCVDVMLSLYNLALEGEYELNFNFGDITYNYEEDRNAWRDYVRQGWIAPWRYLMRFEGFSEEEAKQYVAEAQEKDEIGLFGAEE